MQVFLDDFAKTIGPDEPVVMVLDQAGGCAASAPMHHACAVAALLAELNPVEWV
jgi:hypothetical protein